MNKSYFSQLQIVTTILLLLLIFPVQINAQKTFENELPVDFEKEKVLVVRYKRVTTTTISPTNKMEKRMNMVTDNWNKSVDKMNQKLEKNLKENYPYPYLLINPDEVKKYKDEGYKYILEERSYIEPSRGNSMMYQRTVYDIYTRNLATDDVYILTKRTGPIFYDMKALVKAIKKILSKK